MADKELLEGEAEVLGIVSTSREWASDEIRSVANYCECGMYPNWISPFDLGRALGRALVNCDQKNAEADLIRGLDHFRKSKEAAFRQHETRDSERA